MRKALVINAGWTDNLGDQAINESLCKLLNDRKIETICQGLTTNRPYEYAEGCKNKRSTKSDNSKGLLRILKNKIPNSIKWTLKYGVPNIVEFIKKKNKNIDVAFIGGGQLILSNGMFSYAVLLWYLTIKIFIRCPIVFFAVGSGDKFTKVERFAYRYVLKRCDHVYVRDLNSIKFVKEFFDVDAKYVPDVAFSYYQKIEKDEKNIAMVCIYEYSMYKQLKNINSEEEYMKEWADEVISLIEKGYKVNLTYTTYPDKEQTIKFYDYLNKYYSLENKCRIVYTDTLDKFIEEVNKTSLICTGRMHAMIIGKSRGCEIIPICFTNKLETFKNEYLMNNIDFAKVNEDINKKLDEVLKEL